jgi:hypothetical protein
MGTAGVRMGKMEKKITVRNSLDTTERTVERKEAVVCEKETGILIRGIYLIYKVQERGGLLCGPPLRLRDERPNKCAIDKRRLIDGRSSKWLRTDMRNFIKRVK